MLAISFNDIANIGANIADLKLQISNVNCYFFILFIFITVVMINTAFYV